MSDNRYRPAPTRRDSDRPSASVSDYATDRYRSSRPPSRTADNLPESRRSVSGPYPRSDSRDSSVANAKMDPDRGVKAASDIVNLLRLWEEGIVDRVKWTHKKEVQLEGFRQRLETYERHGGRNAHEPSVAEAWRKHHDHYKQEEDKIEKELTKVNAKIKDSTNSLAHLLVKSLPISEIKERQLIDTAKLELAKDRNSVPAALAQNLVQQLASLVERQDTLATDISGMKKGDSELRTRVSPIEDRTQNLENQMASLLESHKIQEANCLKLTKENEEQRARISVHEAQAADLAALKDHQEQLQLQFNNKASQDKEIKMLKQQKQLLETQVSTLQTQLADLVSRVDSQQADFSRSLQEATAQFAKGTTPADPTTVQEQIRALEIQVKEHDKVFSNIDAEEYAETVTKLIKYPDYPELKRTLEGQDKEVKRLCLETKALSSNMAKAKLEASETSNRLAAIEVKSRSDFMDFSNKVISTCGAPIESLQGEVRHLQGRIQGLQPQAAVTEFGQIEPIKTTVQELQEDQNKLKSKINQFQNEVREYLNAHEVMIVTLDEQFKNMSTLDLANILLDNLKRLPTSAVPLDVQNFHERLVDLEMFRHEQARRGLGIKHWVETHGEDLQKITIPKRSFAETDDGLEQPEKRQRVETMARMNGTGLTG